MGKIIDGVIKLVVAGVLGLLLIGFLMDSNEKQDAEKIQGEYVLTSYSEDPSSPGWRFIVKPDKTVKMKLLNENGEEYDSPWLPGYWETNTTILEGRTIYVITIGNDEFYLNLEDKYATMSEYDMKSKVPLLKSKKVK